MFQSVLDTVWNATVGAVEKEQVNEEGVILSKQPSGLLPTNPSFDEPLILKPARPQHSARPGSPNSFHQARSNNNNLIRQALYMQ